MLIRTLLVFFVVLSEPPAAAGAGDMLGNTEDADMFAVL